MSQTAVLQKCVGVKVASVLEFFFALDNKQLSIDGVNGTLAKQEIPLRLKKEGAKVKLISIDPNVNVEDLKCERAFKSIFIASLLPVAITMSAGFLAYVTFIASEVGLL